MLPPLSVLGQQVAKVVATTVGTWGINHVLDAMLEPGLGFNNQAPATPIHEQTAAQLADGIHITVDVDQQNSQGGDVSAALQRLSNIPGGVQALEGSLSAQMNVPSGSQNGMLGGATDTQLRALKAMQEGALQVRDGHSPEAATALRKVTRKSTDRFRVSMQDHEYRYCVSSGQINTIFQISQIPKEVGDSYGTFVDSVKMRKAIGKFRRLKAISFSANVKFVLGILGISQQNFFQAVQTNAGDFFQLCVEAAHEYNSNGN